MKLSSILLFVLILYSPLCLSQSKKELQEQITKLNSEQVNLKEDVEVLKKQVIALQNELDQLKKENTQLRSNLSSTPQNNNTTTNPSTGQCKATTSKGTQCKRKAESGSNYCWQHKSTYEPTQNTSSSSSSTSTSSSSNSRTIHTGPRGGQYYINSKGNKTYIKKK